MQAQLNEEDNMSGIIDSPSSGNAAMSCGTVMSGADADAVIERCRQLNTDRVALARDSLPGFDNATYSGVPDAGYLKETVERVGEVGIEVYAVSKPYCMGKDMDVIRDPAAHRREIDEMMATVEAVADAGIPVMLQYAHVEDPEDPAEDEDLWGGVAIIFREVVAQAETSGLKLANHGRWPTPDGAARARAAEQGIGYEDYRRFRVPEWEGPFMIRNGDHIARLVEKEAPSPNHGVCMCAGMGMNGTDVLEAVDRFQGKIFFAQPRDLKGTWPQVEEVMPGEGDIDVKEFLRRLHAGGYTGMVHPEHFEDTKRQSADAEADAIEIIRGWISEVTDVSN